jgi:pyruvate,water dikinase
MARTYVIDLTCRAALDRKRSGGKGAGCAHLMRLGFDVPRGFIVTIEAFRAFMAHNHIEAPQISTDAASIELKQMRERIMAAPFPDALRRAIVRSYRRIGGRVAVRSSMNAEDSEITSFAGQLETTLNIEGDDAVLDGIKACYASLYSERVMHYRTRHEASRNERTEVLKMAVVIQQMVHAHTSGVAFTADPISGQRCVIVESAPGRGEKIVNGRVDADRYVVDVRGIISQQRLVHAHSLPEQQVIMLAEHANRIASCMTCPQDIEWVWNGIQFYFLQSRPITTLLEKRIYSRRLVSDMTPGLIKPLVWSTNTLGMMRNVFGTLFSHLTNTQGIRFESFVRRIASRLYADMTAFGELLDRIGLPANFFEVVTRDEKNIRHRPPLNMRLLRTCLRSMPFIVRHARYARAIERFIVKHYRQLQSFKNKQWSSCSEQELISAAEKLSALHGQSQWHMWIATMNMMARSRLLGHLAKRIHNDVLPGNFLRGLNNLKALTPNDEIEKLAEEATRLKANMYRLFLTGDERQISNILAQTADGRTFLKRVNAFIHAYGFLSANGTDFTIAPWIENPTLVWKAIGRVLKTHSHRTSAQIIVLREKERSRVRARLSMPARRFFDALLKATLVYIDLRERMSLIMSEDTYQMRRIFLALSSRFVTRDVLNDRDDIFYLYFDEVINIVQKNIAACDVKEKVEIRKQAMIRDAHIEPAETIAGEHETEYVVEPSDVYDYLVGIGGSSGIVSGRARIIVDPLQAPVNLSRDSILVVPFTDIGWTPLFMGIGGIVAETGGQLSHTSIVAREYGLPAVVSVKNATRLIKEGQHITINGRDGRVYLKTRRM